ncbi:hypothetical protein CRENBAI_017931 [Crenichthys baileyi]|uniref:Uncharacterized protein n=1 Tax=Crenichthys baileyi TaxID=28760 RepID=A0AAV9SKE7_9TELE
MTCSCIALYQVPRDPIELYTTISHPPILTHMYTLTVVSYIVATAALGQTSVGLSYNRCYQALHRPTSAGKVGVLPKGITTETDRVGPERPVTSGNPPVTGRTPTNATIVTSKCF